MLRASNPDVRIFLAEIIPCDAGIFGSGCNVPLLPGSRIGRGRSLLRLCGNPERPTDGEPSGCPWSFGEDHEAHFGWRADELIPRVALAAPRFLPHVALIHLGTNDDVPAANAEIRLLATEVTTARSPVVAVATEVQLSDLRDGAHPSDTGDQLIADAFARPRRRSGSSSPRRHVNL